jgi:carbon monoxide dehydrogenase subunit G
MQIKNGFDIPLPPDEAWDVLMDIPRIAPCMPGAALLGQKPDGSYEGRVAVKLGPIALAFKGVASFVENDAVTKRAQLKAQGTDQQGRGGASGVIVFQLVPCDAGSHVDVVTDVTLTGMVAQYGRGAGVIQSVAAEICNQFAANLRKLIVTQSNASVAQANTTPVGGATADQVPAPGDTPVAARPISGFSLILKVLWQSLKGVWSRR